MTTHMPITRHKASVAKYVVWPTPTDDVRLAVFGLHGVSSWPQVGDELLHPTLADARLLRDGAGWAG